MNVLGHIGGHDPFAGLIPLSYGMIVADPPWTYKNYSRKGEHKGAAAQYSCLSLEDIKALPVGQLAAPNAILVLWATNPLLNQSFEVMKAWGFTFKTAGHWVKKTRNGKLGFGTGYIVRAAGEPFLIGTIGAPKTSRSCRSVIEGPVREHSRKPDEAYAWAEKLLPDVRRLDLFARQERPGWTAWATRPTSSGAPHDHANGPQVGPHSSRRRLSAARLDRPEHA
jgi:N6-adenosine-specific RNA methylase IME4